MINKINNTTINAKLLLPPCPIKITSSVYSLQFMHVAFYMIGQTLINKKNDGGLII
jgi:hypothetical protein